MLTLAQVLEGTGGTLFPAGAAPDLAFSGVVTDSRQVLPGSLFVALRGEHADGHDYAPEAIQRGALGVIAERHIPGLSELQAVSAPPVCILVQNSLQALQRLAGYWRKRLACRVIGVTGSFGKTTTKEAVWSILSQRFSTLKSLGNYNTEIGLPLTLLELEPSHERAVVEMAMNALGEIRMLAEMARPQIGVVTNVGPVHLERLGTLERIAQAKAELVEALPPEGHAILNGDDPLVRDMAQKSRAPVVYFGLGAGCDVSAGEIQGQGLTGLIFHLYYRGRSASVRTPLIGKGGLWAALAGAAVGLAEGMEMEEVARGLEKAASGPRLRALPGPKGSTIIDDTYNANPASAIAALEFLAELPGRKIAILGDMLELGSFAAEGHRQVGRQATELLERLIVVGELGAIIGEEALLSGMPAEKVFFAEGNEEALVEMARLVQPGDCILMKGSRGMKMEEIVEGLVRA